MEKSIPFVSPARYQYFISEMQYTVEYSVRADITYILLFLHCLFVQPLLSQDDILHGQASSWISTSSSSSRFGVRYIPEASIGHALTDELNADLNLAVNVFSSSQYSRERSPLYTGTIRPYRAWGRIASDRFEARLGLQKINFGSALLFRPLMWFDAVDPRDPLQFTDGVTALLLRYYFQDNASIWLWGLYGNNERKGLEISPTKKNGAEFGGRLQLPLLTGEIAATFHRRVADMLAFLPADPFITEERYALDGKWDAGIGMWFETVLIRRETSVPGLTYQRLLTIGADYTFSIGNGVNVATEYFRTDALRTITGTSNGTDLSALSMNYPLNIFDRAALILYRNWTSGEWYRMASFQRTYNNWIVHLFLFWNPPAGQPGLSGQSSATAFAGKGIQVMAVFNH